MAPLFSRRRPLSSRSDTNSSAMYYDHDDLQEETPMPAQNQRRFQSATSTEIIDMYRRQRPNYDSIALANPFDDECESDWDAPPSAATRSKTAAAPLPTLTGRPSTAEQPSQAQYSAINAGLRQHYNPYASSTQGTRQTPVANQAVSSSDIGHLSRTNTRLLPPQHRPHSQPLPTDTPADKTWEGSYLRRGTLRVDANGRKKLDRKALKQEEKDMKRRFKEDKKQAERIAKIKKDLAKYAGYTE